MPNPPVFCYVCFQSVKHTARRLERHLDEMEEVVATTEQRLATVSRLTQRRAEQAKASVKTQVCSTTSIC